MRVLSAPYFQRWYTPAYTEEATEESRTLPPDVKRKPWVSDPFAGGAASGAPASAWPAGPIEDGRIDSLPPHLYPPLDAYPLDLPQDRLPVAVLAGTTGVFSAWPIVPLGQRGVVRKLAAVVTAGALADALFTTRINRAPCQPFPGVRGGIGTIEAPQETLIVLAPGDSFDVLVANTGLLAISVAIRTWGWFWAIDKGGRP